MSHQFYVEFSLYLNVVLTDKLGQKQSSFTQHRSQDAVAKVSVLPIKKCMFSSLYDPLVIYVSFFLFQVEYCVEYLVTLFCCLAVLAFSFHEWFGQKYMSQQYVHEFCNAKICWNTLTAV